MVENVSSGMSTLDQSDLAYYDVSSCQQCRLNLLQVLHLADQSDTCFFDRNSKGFPVTKTEPNSTRLQIDACLEKLLQYTGGGESEQVMLAAFIVCLLLSDWGGSIPIA